MRRARVLVRRIADLIPITPLGALVIAGAFVGLELFGYGQLDLVLLVVGWAGLGMPLLSIIVVTLTALLMRSRAKSGDLPRAEPLGAETRRAIETGFVLPSLWLLPLVHVRWTWEQPADVHVTPRRTWLRAVETALFAERGEVRGVVRRLEISDVLGLARIAVRARGGLAANVLPSCGRLRRMPALLALAGGDETPHPMGLEDGDRIELRRYQPGDPARLVHWKVYARTRKLMVRWPERALVKARRTIAYLVAGAGDDATAGAARLAVESDAFGGDWVFGADGGPHGGTSRRDEALALIVRSAAQRETSGAALEGFLSRAERSGPASVVLFVPPTDGPWLPRVLAVLAKRRRVRVVIAVDAVVKRTARSVVDRVIARALAEPEGVDAKSLDRVLRSLGTARAEITVLDRSSGQVLGDAHRARLGRAA